MKTTVKKIGYVMYRIGNGKVTSWEINKEKLLPLIVAYLKRKEQGDYDKRRAIIYR